MELGKEKLNADRHIIYYAKGWYKRTDLIEDLKILLAERTMIPKEYITVRDILTVLADITFPIIQKNYNMFINFISGILPENTPFHGYVHNQSPLAEDCGVLPNYDVTTAIISKMLSMICNTGMTELNITSDELGNPDFEGLQLTHVNI